MDSTSIKISEELTAEIDSLIKKGYYTSRSEFIRNAILDKIISMKK